jgi:hypothetical protein
MILSVQMQRPALTTSVRTPVWYHLTHVEHMQSVKPNCIDLSVSVPQDLLAIHTLSAINVGSFIYIWQKVASDQVCPPFVSR